jgi:hypothetical protein
MKRESLEWVGGALLCVLAVGCSGPSGGVAQDGVSGETAAAPAFDGTGAGRSIQIAGHPVTVVPLSKEAAASMKILASAGSQVDSNFEGLVYKGGTGADSITVVGDPNAAKEIMYELMTHDGSTLDAGSTFACTPLVQGRNQQLGRRALSFWNGSSGVGAVQSNASSLHGRQSDGVLASRRESLRHDLEMRVLQR